MPERLAPKPAAWRSPIVLASAGAIVIGLAVVAGILVAAPPPPAPTPVPTGSAIALTLPTAASPFDLADGRAIGRSNAPATLIVYEDFQCPLCGRFTREVQPRLYTDFVVPGDLRIVFRDFAFIGQESLDAAAAARCAGEQGKFWQYHDYLFWNQGPENGGAFSRSRLDAIAGTVGLDGDRFDTCLGAGQELNQVNAESDAANAAGINQTPTLVIDNQTLPGAPLSAEQYLAISNVIKASIEKHSTPAP